MKYSFNAHDRAVLMARLVAAGLPAQPWEAFNLLVAREQAKGVSRYSAMINVGKAQPALWDELRAHSR